MIDVDSYFLWLFAARSRLLVFGSHSGKELRTMSELTHGIFDTREPHPDGEMEGLRAERDRLQAALQRYVLAQSRMRDRWADGDDHLRKELWQDLHACEDGARTILATPESGTTEPLCATCGHHRLAHAGHTHPAGTPEPTHCSQGCGCKVFVESGTPHREPPSSQPECIGPGQPCGLCGEEYGMHLPTCGTIQSQVSDEDAAALLAEVEKIPPHREPDVDMTSGPEVDPFAQQRRVMEGTLAAVVAAKATGGTSEGKQRSDPTAMQSTASLESGLPTAELEAAKATPSPLPATPFDGMVVIVAVPDANGDMTINGKRMNAVIVSDDEPVVHATPDPNRGRVVRDAMGRSRVEWDNIGAMQQQSFNAVYDAVVAAERAKEKA